MFILKQENRYKHLIFNGKHRGEELWYILHLASLHCHVGFRCVLSPCLGFQHLKDGRLKINVFPFAPLSGIFRKIFIAN